MSVDIVAQASPRDGTRSRGVKSDRDLPPFVHMSAIPATLRRPTTHTLSHRPYYRFFFQENLEASEAGEHQEDRR
jgi:hypothetical protein